MESKNNKLYYDVFIGEFLGYKVFTAKHMPIEKVIVSSTLVQMFLGECVKERKKFKVDGLGENRGEISTFKARVHWEDREMTIIDTESAMGIRMVRSENNG